MEYVRVQSIEDPLFAEMHRLMGGIFPPEEVLAFELWKEPLADPAIQVYVALHEGEVVGATEYRYVPHLKAAMTDFTIIGRPGLGIGRFLYVNREKDLRRLERESGTESIGIRGNRSRDGSGRSGHHGSAATWTSDAIPDFRRTSG